MRGFASNYHYKGWGKVPAVVVEAPRTKGLASGKERRESLTKNVTSSQKLKVKGKCRFTDGRALETEERIFSTSLDARR